MSSMMQSKIHQYRTGLSTIKSMQCVGRVDRVVGLSVEAIGPQVSINEICHLVDKQSGASIDGEVVGFRDGRVLIMPLGPIEGISTDSQVVATRRTLSVPVGEELMGRVVDGLGRPIDGQGDVRVDAWYPIYGSAIDPINRPLIDRPLSLGVRAIDGLMTCGRGQRIGIFAGSGVGKSTLMSMISKNVEADVNVIALVGERGREVREFIEKHLGEEGMKRSVVVVATSDSPALIRLKSAMTATAIAEYFRDQGKDVMLMMDSLTRFAMAHREVSLSAGEPPVSRGYPPSLFTVLPRLLERSGRTKKGSITGIYTVLVDGDDMNEPVSDAVRSILDGHIVLSRALAARGHYPAIDVLHSVSRLMTDLASGEHIAGANEMRRILATYDQSRDIISIGAYKRGSDPNIDYAIDHIKGVNDFLCQSTAEHTSIDESIERIVRIGQQEVTDEIV